MKGLGFQFTEAAEDDLDEIWEYIAADNIDAADQIVLQVRSACQRLAEHPGIGHTREDLTKRPLKFWSVYSYLIVYEPNFSPLQIIAVLHAARDVELLMKVR